MGEQQRTAIARALAVRTSVLLADEPSGHQDNASAERVFAALRRAADAGTAVVVATHNREVIRYLDRVLTMKDGRWRKPLGPEEDPLLSWPRSRARSSVGERLLPRKRSEVQRPAAPTETSRSRGLSVLAD